MFVLGAVAVAAVIFAAFAAFMVGASAIELPTGLGVFFGYALTYFQAGKEFVYSFLYPDIVTGMLICSVAIGLFVAGYNVMLLVIKFIGEST